VWKLIASASGIAVVGLGAVMALTNPNEEAYSEYAADRLIDYMKENACTKERVPQQQCEDLIGSLRSQIQGTIANRSDRQNFILFSIYETDFESPPLLPIPSYHFETLGILNSFHVYKGEET